MPPSPPTSTNPIHSNPHDEIVPRDGPGTWSHLASNFFYIPLHCTTKTGIVNHCNSYTDFCPTRTPSDHHTTVACDPFTTPTVARDIGAESATRPSSMNEGRLAADFAAGYGLVCPRVLRSSSRLAMSLGSFDWRSPATATAEFSSPCKAACSSHEVARS